MSRKRQSDEERVMEFFETAPLPVAVSILNLATQAVRKRSPNMGQAAPKRKKKTASAPGASATAVPAETAGV
jgi:hypothetical protein